MAFNGNLLLAALKGAASASKEILEIYQTEDFGVEMKGDNSPLTKADQAGHNAIMSFLEGTGIPVLSEEGRDIDYSERKSWNTLWIVDPLDGTKEFIKRNGEFTVNIALIENQVPVLGVVWVPVLQEVFIGYSDKGALKVSAKDVEEILQSDDISDAECFARLKANGLNLPAKKPEVFTMVGSRSHMSEETKDYMALKEKEHGSIDIISKGSSLKLCMVAEGLANEYPRFAPTMEWDTAAGQAVCMSAGFTVVEYPSLEAMKYNREELLNKWFLVR